MDKKYTDVKGVQRGAKEASWIVGNRWTWASSGSDIVTVVTNISEEHIFAMEMSFESGGGRFLLNAGSYLLEYQA